MKIKSLSNKDDLLGAGIIYSLVLLLIFGGSAYAYNKPLLLIPPFLIIGLIVFLSRRKLRRYTFYTDRLEVTQPGISDKITRYEIKDIVLRVGGGPVSMSSNSVGISAKGLKLGPVKLNTTEWEFEEFYHETLTSGYQWKFHYTVKDPHARNYELFLKRKAVMDRNR